MTVEVPENIDEHIQHAKMLVGEPVLRVNITDLQARIAVKSALHKFTQYHDNAVDTAWLTQVITPDIQTNSSFVVNEAVNYVIEVAGVSGVNYRWIGDENASVTPMSQFAPMSNWFGGVSGYDKLGLYLMNREQSYIESKITPPPVWTFSQTSKRLTIEDSSENFELGAIIAYKAHISLENTSSAFWASDWFLHYTAALIKKQWGTNLSKFVDVEMPGGFKVNSDGILSEAKEEIEKLNESLFESSSVFFTAISIG